MRLRWLSSPNPGGVVTWLCPVSGVLGATQAEIEHHLEMGRKLLAAGQLAEALSHYHSAVGKVTHADTHSHADIGAAAPPRHPLSRRRPLGENPFVR